MSSSVVESVDSRLSHASSEGHREPTENGDDRQHRYSEGSSSNSGCVETGQSDASAHRGAWTAYAGRIVGEGHLKEVVLRAERSLDGGVLLLASAKCDGSTLRSRLTSWHGRHAEVARSLMSELLGTVRDVLSESPLSAPSMRRSERRSAQGLARWREYAEEKAREAREAREARGAREAREAREGTDTDTDTGDEAYEEDYRPIVLIQHIAWGNALRGPADSSYDPAHDGDITLAGSVLLEGGGEREFDEGYERGETDEGSELVHRTHRMNLADDVAHHLAASLSVVANAWDVVPNAPMSGSLFTITCKHILIRVREFRG